ncbi:Porphobilinogen deaminase [Rhodanobacter lindaniclasticus]
MPGYFISKIADNAPMKTPSTSAYSGAVTGAQVFLNTVTRASTRPPMAPPIISGPIAERLSGPLNWLQLNAAPTTARISSRPVLLTVPLRVITSSPCDTTAPLAASRKVFLLSAGLPLCMVNSAGICAHRSLPPSPATAAAPIRRAAVGRPTTRQLRPCRLPRSSHEPFHPRIATRKSALALWQAEHVAALLRAAHPGLGVELVPLSTRGDEVLTSRWPRSAARGCSSRSWRWPCWRVAPSWRCIR